MNKQATVRDNYKKHPLFNWQQENFKSSDIFRVKGPYINLGK